MFQMLDILLESFVIVRVEKIHSITHTHTCTCTRTHTHTHTQPIINIFTFYLQYTTRGPSCTLFDPKELLAVQVAYFPLILGFMVTQEE